MANRALIVTAGEYADPQLPRLRAAVADAQRLQRVLERGAANPYEVTSLTDPPLLELRVAIQEFFSRAGPNDLNLLILSGHGVRDLSARFYYAVPETRTAYLAATALAGRFIREQLQESAARRNVIVLDTCFAGAFGHDFLAKRAVISEGVPEELTEAKGAVVIAAASSVQLALEAAQPDPQSLFLASVCEGLESGLADADGDGWITAHDLFEYARESLAERGAEQTPELNSFGLSEDLKLFKIRQAQEAVSVDSDIASAVNSLHDELRAAAVVVLGKYGASYNEGRRAVARRYLRSLQQDPDERIRRAASEALRSSRRDRRPPSPKLRTRTRETAAGEATIRISNRELRLAADAVPQFAGDESLIRVLNNIRIDVHGGVASLYATNRFLLALRRLKYSSSQDIDIQVGVAATDFSALRRLPVGGVTEIDVASDRIEFSTGDKCLLVPRRDVSTFPKVENLLKDDGVPFYVGRAEMVDAIEYVSPLGTGAPIVMAIDSDKALLAVTSESRVREVPIQLSAGAADVTAAFNPSFLLSTFAVLQEGVLACRMPGPKRPLRVEPREFGEPAQCYLVMPRILPTN